MQQSSSPKTGVTIPINPAMHMLNNPREMLVWMQSIYKTLRNGTMLAQPRTTNAAGIYNTFSTANGNGVTLRIGANGSSEKLTWNSSGQITINHSLQRQPIGYHVLDIDAPAIINRLGTATLDQDNITLQTNLASVNATVYIF